MKQILITFLLSVFCYADYDYNCKNNNISACIRALDDKDDAYNFCLYTDNTNYLQACASSFMYIVKDKSYDEAVKLKDRLCDLYPDVSVQFFYIMRNIPRSDVKEILSKACELDYIKACDILIANGFKDNIKYIEKSCDGGNYEACIELEYIKLKNNNLALAETECLQNNNCEKAFNEGTKIQEILLKLCENKNEKACLRYAELNASENNGKYDEYSLKACKINVNICMQKAKSLEQFLQFDFEGNIKTLKRYYEIACEKGLDIACEELKRVEALNPDDYKFDGKVKTIRIKF